jgi:predicted DNA-binding transcriptional regulator AlpA
MKLLTDKQIADKLSCARSFVWVLAKRPGFPKPLKLAPMKATRWVEAEIDAWIESMRGRVETTGERNGANDTEPTGESVHRAAREEGGAEEAV